MYTLCIHNTNNSKCLALARCITLHASEEEEAKTCNNNNEKQKQLNIMTFILELLLMQQILRIINIKVQEITINRKINRDYALHAG